MLVLLRFGGSLATKCLSMNNQLCMARLTLVDLNLGELNPLSFIISLSRCNRNCSTVQGPFGGISLSNKMEELNLKVFNFSILGVK